MTYVDLAAATQVLNLLGAPQLLDEITIKGSGSQLYTALHKSKNGLSLQALLEFYLTETQGKELQVSIKKTI